MKYLKLFEDYKSTSWSDTINGKKITITIQDIENYLKNNPVIEIPLNEIKNVTKIRLN